ncbi:MAG TPA: hypothetical protein VN794_12910 [Methylomirabilota bacterium]|nr:hypothetical protein [Methylomirabilota bacterium]
MAQVFNLQALRGVAGDLIALERAIWSVQSFRDLKAGVRSAGWKPAIQQVENLRYAFGLTSAIEVPQKSRGARSKPFWMQFKKDEAHFEA